MTQIDDKETGSKFDKT